MSNLIQTNEISGFKVYGQQMVDYTVDGVSNQGYSNAVIVAALRHTSTMERAASGMSALLRARQQKLDELGTALAVIVKAIDTMSAKNQKSGDKSEADSQLKTVKSTLAKYGISLEVSDDNKVTRKNASTARYDVQYAMDNEDNDMQQDLVTMQGMVSKRDNAFSTASKLLKKADDTGATIIKSM